MVCDELNYTNLRLYCTLARFQMSLYKQKLYERCVQHIQQRMDDLRKAIKVLQLSANEETKSSVGDKYETGRAMVQLEIEKLLVQLSACTSQRQVLERIDPALPSTVIQLGSVVKTNHGNFFLSVSAGQLSVDAENFMAISPASPIGAKLMGLRATEKFSIHDREYSITSVE